MKNQLKDVATLPTPTLPFYIDLDNGYYNWHEVLKKSHRHAHDNLIENLLVELTDQWVMKMIIFRIRISAPP